MTFTTVGFPYFNASVKKIVPTAEPAKPEKTRYPQVRAWILRISSKRETRRSGANMIRISTCSQKTITLASNSALSGMRHALSVPQSAAPRPTSHGPYGAPVELGLAILKRLPSAVCRINADDFILDYENGSIADFSRFLECVIIQTRLESRPSKDRKSTIRRLCRDYRRFLR